MSAEQLSLAYLRILQDIGRPVHLARGHTDRLQSSGGTCTGVRARVHADTCASNSPRLASRASPVANAQVVGPSRANPNTVLAERHSASERIEMRTIRRRRRTGRTS